MCTFNAMSLLMTTREIMPTLNENRKLNIDFILEYLCCVRQDEHLIEAPDYGDTIFPVACAFSKESPYILACADDAGGVLILDTTKPGPLAVLSEWLAHENAVFDIAWTHQKENLLTASGDQKICLWDVKTEEKISSFKGHTSSVKTVTALEDSQFVFASGSRDGNIMLWDTRVKQKDGFIPPVNVMKNAHSLSVPMKKRKQTSALEARQGVTAVVFQDENNIISAGSVDGSVKLWDTRKNYSLMKTEAVPKHAYPYAGSSARSRGFSSLVLDSTRSRVFASCMDHMIYQYDCAGLNKEPVAVFRGHKNSSFYIKADLSYDDTYLVSGSSDGNAYIWRVDSPQASPLVLSGHLTDSEVSCVAWCKNDITKLVTTGDDSTVKIWRIDRTEQKDEAGIIIGKTERKHREIGITAGTTSTKCMSPGPVLKSSSAAAVHRKGTVLPKSPVKMSSTMKRSIKSLTKKHTKDAAEMSTDQSIASFFGNSTSAVQLNSPSPKKTPRKLLIKGDRNISVKRKLCEAEDTNLQSPKCKKMKVGNDENSNSPLRGYMSGVKFLDGEQTVIVPSEVTAVRKDLLSDLCLNKAPVAKPSFQSPTVDLPNYVNNPEPRTPVALVKEIQPRTPDWLTQFRLSKDPVDCEKTNTNSPGPTPTRKPSSVSKKRVGINSPTVNPVPTPTGEPSSVSKKRVGIGSPTVNPVPTPTRKPSSVSKKRGGINSPIVTPSRRGKKSAQSTPQDSLKLASIKNYFSPKEEA